MTRSALYGAFPLNKHNKVLSICLSDVPNNNNNDDDYDDDDEEEEEEEKELAKQF